MTAVEAGSVRAHDFAFFSTERRRLFFEICVLTGAVLVFLVSVLPNLANHPALTDDEVWVMSASYKLAREGVFGSDMFRGFFDADRYYFFNMPAHHFAVAGSFKVLGYGVLQARLVGVLYGLATLFLTHLIARRLFGVAAAALAVGLLLFLRLNMGFDTGLPLQELSASIRYDLAPVPFVLGAFLVVLGGLTWRRAAVAGALVGLSTLFQFYAAFAMLPIVVFYLLAPVERRQRLALSGVLVIAAGLACLPYGIFAAAHLQDFRGQAGTVGRRDDVTSVSFYANNLRNEIDRFIPPLSLPVGFSGPQGADPLATASTRVPPLKALPRRPSAKIGILLGLPAALVFTGLRGFRKGRPGDRLLFLFLVTLPLEYALFDQLKLYVYWFLVVPFLCIGIGGVSAALLQPGPSDKRRLALAGVTACCLLFVFAEGSIVRVPGLQAAGRESDYAATAAGLHATVPAGSRVVGSTSLWWALRDTDFRSYFMLFYLTNPNAREYRTKISAYLSDFRPDYLVLTRLGSEELRKHLVPPDYADYQGYLSNNATLVARLDGPDVRSYKYIEVWHFNPRPD